RVAHHRGSPTRDEQEAAVFRGEAPRCAFARAPDEFLRSTIQVHEIERSVDALPVILRGAWLGQSKGKTSSRSDLHWKEEPLLLQVPTSLVCHQCDAGGVEGRSRSP